jgi:NTE family protein
MRHSAPIASAIHLGATRVLVVGAGRMNTPIGEAALPVGSNYPSLAQIAGHALANIFLDALAADVELVRRINQTLALVPPEVRSASVLRPVELLVITPSQHLDAIAARHSGALPASLRSALGIAPTSTGALETRGAALASYLLFETGYTSELMALGRADVQRQRSEVCKFFGWVDPDAAPGAATQAPRPERRRDPLRVR